MEPDCPETVRSRGWPRALFVSAVVGASIGAAAWWYRGPAALPARVRPDLPPSAPTVAAYEPPATAGYLGGAACAKCHAEIAETYKTHPMSRSIVPVDAESEPPISNPRDTRVMGQQRLFEVENAAGVMRHHELMYDDAGELIYDQAVRITYVVGSGRRARAYLHHRGPLLFMSPLNWYARTQQWDLAPGYKPDDPRRFDRRVTDECLSCHTGRVAPVGRSLNQYENPPFRELAISCENCHGPGQRHVAFHESGTPAGDDPIVNPARLDPARRESVCNQCHFQTAVRVLRPGRNDLDFRPGQNLDEIWTLLDADAGVTDDGRTRSLNHVQQMRASRCYSGSAGRLGCTSCHDPHRAPAAAERDRFYRSKCNVCHAESSCKGPAEQRAARADSCITCHMPAREASNVSHVSQTDHRVVRKPRVDGTGGSPRGGDELAFIADTAAALSRGERDRALGLAAWMHLSKKGHAIPEAVGQFLAQQLSPDSTDGPVLLALGALAEERQNALAAQEYFERARRLPGAEEAALLGLVDLYYLASDHQNCLTCLDRLLELELGSAKLYALRADVLAAVGRRNEGIDAAMQALALNPTLVPVREWLVRACRAAGREQDGREQEQILIRMRGARVPR